MSRVYLVYYFSYLGWRCNFHDCSGQEKRQKPTATDKSQFGFYGNRTSSHCDLYIVLRKVVFFLKIFSQMMLYYNNNRYFVQIKDKFTYLFIFLTDCCAFMPTNSNKGKSTTSLTNDNMSWMCLFGIYFNFLCWLIKCPLISNTMPSCQPCRYFRDNGASNWMSRGLVIVVNCWSVCRACTSK